MRLACDDVHGVEARSRCRRAAEAGGFVDAAGALVPRHLRIRTERPCPQHLALDHARPHDRLGYDTLLYPFDERGQGVERADTGTAAAVIHAGHHEEAVEVGRRRPHLLRHAFVVANAHHRVERGIGPAEVADYLAAARLVARQIRIGGIEDAARPLNLL